MKFSCQKSVLNETIANVGLAVASHSTIAALEGILMECSADQVKLTGYSLDFGILKIHSSYECATRTDRFIRWTFVQHCR